MAKVVIGSNVAGGYWALGSHWPSPGQVSLEVSSESYEAEKNDDYPAGAAKFAKRAALIAEGKITAEDLARAKADPMLVVVEVPSEPTPVLAQREELKGKGK